MPLLSDYFHDKIDIIKPLSRYNYTDYYVIDRHITFRNKNIVAFIGFHKKTKEIFFLYKTFKYTIKGIKRYKTMNKNDGLYFIPVTNFNLSNYRPPYDNAFDMLHNLVKESVNINSINDYLKTYYKRNKDYLKRRLNSNAPGSKILFRTDQIKNVRIHYDLRIPINHKLLSFAIPKKMITTIHNKPQFAIETVPHPFWFLNFQGVITSDYGMGEIEIYDSGKFKLIEYVKDKKIKFMLNGVRYKNQLVSLIHLHGRTKFWVMYIEEK